MYTTEPIGNYHDQYCSLTAAMFRVEVTNVSEKGTITTSDGTDVAVPLSPVSHAVHGADTKAFENGEPASEGLEALAEDGMAPKFTAELGETAGVKTAGTTAITKSGEKPGPALPGQTFSFTINAVAGDRFSMATMFVQSNDLFYAFDPEGIDLFPNGTPISGDITSELTLWDAGTEVNQEPGAGDAQAPRQSMPGVGADENRPIQPVSARGATDDGFEYPATSEVIRVSIEPVSQTN